MRRGQKNRYSHCARVCSILQQGTFAGMVDRRTLNIVLAGANNASGIAPAPASRSVDYTGVPVTVPFD